MNEKPQQSDRLIEKLQTVPTTYVQSIYELNDTDNNTVFSWSLENYFTLMRKLASYPELCDLLK